MLRRPALVLLLAWLTAGTVAGVRLHGAGGVFGEAVPLGWSVAGQLVAGVPWLMAAAVAWWAAGRWPLRRDDLLRPVTIHAWLGMGVVVAQQVLLAALRDAVLPPGLAPLDPWAVLPAELVLRGPAALGVYGVLTGVALLWRGGDGAADQDVPAAGRGAPPSS